MTADLITPAATRRRMIVFWLASGASFLLYLHRYTWNLIRPELQQEYGFSNTTLEQLGTAFYATYSLGSIPSGVVIDLLGAHLVLGSIILAWSLILPLHSMMDSVLGLGCVRLLFGAAQTGTYPAIGQVTRNWFPRGNRTQVQGWIASFFGRGGGALSSVVMGTLLMGTYGLSWKTALVVMSVPGVIFALVFLAVFRNTPEDDPRANEAEGQLIRGTERAIGEPRGVILVRRALGNSTLRVMVANTFIYAGADVVYTLLLGSFFLSLGVESMQSLGWLVSLPLIGGALGGVTGGMLNDRLILRFGSRWGRSLVGCTGQLAAAVALLIAIRQPNPAHVAWGLFVVKFFSDWAQPTGWGTCTDVGGRFSATVLSITNTAGNVGALLMPLLFGPLLDYFSQTTLVDGEARIVTDFGPMFLVVSGMYAASGLLWLLIDCTQRVDEPAASEV